MKKLWARVRRNLHVFNYMFVGHRGFDIYRHEYYPDDQGWPCGMEVKSRVVSIGCTCGSTFWEEL